MQKDVCTLMLTFAIISSSIKIVDIMKLGIIGAGGNMAGAIITGILDSEVVLGSDLYLFDTQPEKTKKYQTFGANICPCANDVIANSDYIILAVKPQVFDIVLKEISSSVTSDKCIISIAAGIKIETIENYLSCKCAVARVMPNTPLMVSEGASGIAFNSFISDLQKENVLSIFEASGACVCCKEDEINIVTAISGSSPAYFLRMIKVMAEKAEEMGLDINDAYKLIIQSMIGAATLLRESENSAQELIDMITSPKGTTLAALEKMTELKFDETVRCALDACYNRAEELGR